MIRFDDVSYAYPYQASDAVTSISFEVPEGSAVLFTGASGCGKSTLIRLINGLIPHVFSGYLRGRVQVAGRDNRDRDLHEIAGEVGTLFQDPEHQFLTLNVADEIAFAHEWRGVAPTDILDLIEASADRFQLRHLLRSDILTLSEGEKQKVALAAVVSLNPRLLVLDEPSANLDPTATIELASILVGLKRTGMTLLIADHRLYWLREVVDTVYIMSRGRIARRGDFTVLDNDATRKRYGLRRSRLDTIPQIVSSSPMGAGIDISDLTFAYEPERPLFRDACMRLPMGKVTALVGENGTGKTTLARLLTGLQRMPSGTVAIRGQRIPPAKLLQRGRIVLQNTDHQLHMRTVSQELEICARSLGKYLVAARAREVMAQFDLGHLAGRHPQSLSGGEKQRLVIACAMVKGPELLILDEPTSGLDGRNMHLICQILRNAACGGACVLLITHDLELIDLASDGELRLPLP